MTLSTPYNYHYKQGRRVAFQADEPGEYVFELRSRLVFDDDLYPGKRTASAQLTLQATGDSVTGGGCSATHGGESLAGMLALVGLALARRRRR